MKPFLLRNLIVAAIVGLVLFGSAKINNNKLIAHSEDFSIAHADLWIPEIEADHQDCRGGLQNELLVPPPDAFYLQDYEKELYNFVLRRKYDTELHWCVDKRMRDTGPFSQGEYYGVHPAVRIYYSPRMMYWLTGNPDYWAQGKASGEAKIQAPRSGKVPNGAMIIKEMYFPPADIYAELARMLQENDEAACHPDAVYENILSKLISSWTIMVKADANSNDGWFWANPGAVKPSDADTTVAVNRQLDAYNNLLYSSFGQPTCLRCHVSAEKDFTFSTLKNVAGSFRLDQQGVYTYCDTCREENILNFYSDDSWRDSIYLHKHQKPDRSFIAQLFDLNDPCLDSTSIKKLFEFPQALLPWSDKKQLAQLDLFNPHLRLLHPSSNEVSAERYSSINPAFAATFPQIPDLHELKRFPSQWTDHVVQKARQTSHYITSDNCLGCHGGLGGAPPDVTMFIQTGPNYGDGYNVSEYGEWRWSPMGLAGRDPIFYAQLESEMALLDQATLAEQVTSTCLSCHGAMGQRQLKLDARQDKTLDSLFRADYIYLTKALSKQNETALDSVYHKYGELAREGISCAVCHHIDEPDSLVVEQWATDNHWISPKSNLEEKKLAYMLFNNTTGRYVRGPANVLNGPFEDVKIMPMQHALGITPKQSKFIQNSQLCGSCHTINLPNIGQKFEPNSVLNAAETNPAFQGLNHTIEQATFLEWQNSSFGQFAKLGEFQSCQDCHMPGGFQSLDGSINLPQLITKIATIQDPSYPTVENEAPHQEINVPFRKDYKRHEHVGLNVFLLEMFDQFPDVLGVDKMDPMTFATNGNALAIENMIRQARQATIDLDLKVQSYSEDSLQVEVTVKNKTGHRFPSGVSFRRAFLEFLVLDGADVIWGSGRTNSVGVIVDEYGRPLATEFLDKKSQDTIHYQPHYQLITSQDQVQIYEELNQDADHRFTTSFIHRVYPIKDNRLLPRGWRASSFFQSQGELMAQFMAATDPDGVGNDPNYAGVRPPDVFKGQDKLIYSIQLPKGIDLSKLSVKVTMHYQSIPPYYLNQRFTLAPEGAATQRLFYLTSHLNLEGTAMKDWKLPLVSKQLGYCEDNGAWEEILPAEEEVCN